MDSDYVHLSESLTQALDLQQSPVAMCFRDTLPSGIESGAPRVAAGCRFWQEGAQAAVVTSAADHSLCAVGVYTHHLQSTPALQSELGDALKVFGELGYVRPEDIALIPVLEKEPKYIVYAPLAETSWPPDVVLLFVNARQTLLLSEATQQVELQTPPAMGRPACAVVPQVINSGRAALSLGCCGARAYLDVLTDDVALFAIPGQKLAAYTERIVALSTANRTLTQFHHLRRNQVAAGESPTIQQSLAALTAS